MSHQLIWRTALVLCVLPGALRAGDIPETFTLGKYVPDTCWLYVHGVDNPERAHIDQQWAKVFEALRHSGMAEEVKNLVTGLLPEQERVDFQEQWSRIVELCQDVSWGDLVGREVVFAMQLSPVPTYLFLCRGAPGSGERNGAVLSQVLEQLASLDDELGISRVPSHGFNRCCLTIPGVPFCVDLFHKKDLVGISTSPLMTKRVLSLAAGDGEGAAIIDSQRFRRAWAALPDPEDSLTYLDFKALAADLKNLLAQAFAQTGPGPETDPTKKALLGILERLDVFDYMSAVQHTDGLQEVEATNFSVSVAIDFNAAYALVLDIIRNDVPDGEAVLGTWAETQKELGFHVQEDLLDWLSGELVSVTLPAARPTLMSYTDPVLMLRVKDPTLAAQKVEAGVVRLRELAKKYTNMELLEAPAAVKAPGFRTLTFPPLMAFGQPVVGVHDRWLIVGGSVEAINACLATAAGEHPSILEAERFRKEGILRNDPVSSASFTDLSNLQLELAGMFQGMGAVGGMLSQTIADKEAAKAVQSMMAMIHRLAPVVAQIDFFSSQASYCTFDGLAWKMEMVTTYKAPPSAGE